jgi:hypothetical protein
MSLYNMICGNNPLLHLYIRILGMDQLPPRFRDAYVTIGPADEPAKIVLYTRTGGGNRAEYAAQNEALTKHPLYERDFDDDFDNTYAHWVFRVPPEHVNELIQLHTIINRWEKFFSPRQKFENVLASMREKPKPHVGVDPSQAEAEIVAKIMMDFAAKLGLRTNFEQP